MRLDSERLAERLSRQLSSIYVVHAGEPLLALEAAERIRKAARAAGFVERVRLVAEAGFRWTELAAATRSLSLFATKKLIELHIPNAKPGNEGAAALQACCSSLSPEWMLLIILPKLGSQKQSGAWFDSLERNAVIVEAAPVGRDALPRWIGARLQAQGQRTDAAAARFLADRVEGNLLAAHQELQKLGLLFPKGELTLEQIQHAVLDVARFDVYKLADALYSEDSARFARTLRALREEGEAPPLILWALAAEIRTLAAIKLGLERGHGLARLFEESRVPVRRREPIEKAVRRLDSESLEAALLHASTCDRMIKGLAAGDIWAALLALGLRLRGEKGLV